MGNKFYIAPSSSKNLETYSHYYPLHCSLSHRRPQELHSMNLAKLEAEKKKNYILPLPSTTIG